VVAHSTIDKRDSFYWMWWDMILHTFWQMVDDYKEDYSGLSPDSKRICDAMYLTLLNILALPQLACQWSALHGLGHLHHPLGWLAVQSYLNAHRTELSDEDAQWVEDCSNRSIA
jgi:hypothetical protein